jgi:hypothetical protein
MADAELSDLPLTERVRHYRELAMNSRKLAQSAANQDRRDLLLLIAEQWERLAGDDEQRLARGKSYLVAGAQ